MILYLGTGSTSDRRQLQKCRQSKFLPCLELFKHSILSYPSILRSQMCITALVIWLRMPSCGNLVSQHGWTRRRLESNALSSWWNADFSKNKPLVLPRLRCVLNCGEAKRPDYSLHSKTSLHEPRKDCSRKSRYAGLRHGDVCTNVWTAGSTTIDIHATAGNRGKRNP